jgi:hypothetical protein
MGVLETDDQRTEFRQRKPKRHLPPEHAAFAVGIRPGRSLAGDHEHDAGFAGLRPLQESQQRGVGSALRHAMQIDPIIDRVAAARHPLAQSPTEWGKRRGSFLAWRFLRRSLGGRGYWIA